MCLHQLDYVTFLNTREDSRWWVIKFVMEHRVVDLSYCYITLYNVGWWVKMGNFSVIQVVNSPWCSFALGTQLIMFVQWLDVIAISSIHSQCSWFLLLLFQANCVPDVCSKTPVVQCELSAKGWCSIRPLWSSDGSRVQSVLFFSVVFLSLLTS